VTVFKSIKGAGTLLSWTSEPDLPVGERERLTMKRFNLMLVLTTEGLDNKNMDGTCISPYDIVVERFRKRHHKWIRRPKKLGAFDSHGHLWYCFHNNCHTTNKWVCKDHKSFDTSSRFFNHLILCHKDTVNSSSKVNFQESKVVFFCGVSRENRTLKHDIENMTLEARRREHFRFFLAIFLVAHLSPKRGVFVHKNSLASCPRCRHSVEPRALTCPFKHSDLIAWSLLS